MSKSQKPTRIEELVTASRARERRERLQALADGRRQRSATFRAKKGPGSYRRSQRHHRGCDP